MSAVEVTITGTLYDKLNRTTQQVVLIGEATLTGLGVGGGPMPGGPGGGPRPSHPIALPGDPWWGGGGPVDPGFHPPGVGPGVPGTRPPPGAIDPDWGVTPVPPGAPNVPPPGSPPVMVGGTQPVQPITPPPAVIIEYPGIGKVVVPLPTATVPPPGGAAAPKK